jgi:ribosomal protein L37AE/L43A
MSEKHILIFGNPVDGLTFVGPFDTHEEAVTYGEPIAEEWWVSELDEPTNEPENKEELCPDCDHPWSEHTQNVHGTWVCQQCNCRTLAQPAEVSENQE